MSKNEQENKKHEMIADIVKEMRECDGHRAYYDGGLHHESGEESVVDVDYLHNFADRIEAAWEREREELDKRISDLEAYAKLWTVRADELRLKCDEFYAKAKPVGNAAAMREALVEAIGETCAGCKRDCDDCMNLKSGWMKKAKAALSAPPRNCDVGTVEEHAQRFYNFCESNSSGINGMCKPTCPCIDCFDKCQCFAKWAQMPYEDEEGGAK